MKYLIRNLKRLLFGLALAPLALTGQQSDTVFTSIAVNAIGTGVQATKPRNIGQSFHLLSITPNNIAACATWTGLARLQGSFDNTVWTNVGNALVGNAATIGVPIYITGAGSFPYLRINVLANPAGCGLDITYSGNITGSLTTNTQTPLNDGFLYKSVSGNGFGALGNAATGVACNIPDTRLVLYSLWVTNGVATAATTTAKVKVINTTTLVAEHTFFLFGLGAGQTLGMNNGPRPIYMSSLVPAAQGIDLVFDQAAGDGLNIVAVGRCE